MDATLLDSRVSRWLPARENGVAGLGSEMIMMLCGAADARDVRDSFANYVSDVGGTPWSYLTGKIEYVNSATASWAGNSRASVAKADLCVFVILRDYGEITWTVELQDALNNGKPFVILCLQETYDAYRTLRGRVSDFSAITDEPTRLLIQTFEELEAERQLTLEPFQYSTFIEVLRGAVAQVFTQGLHKLQQSLQRAAVSAVLTGSRRLTAHELLLAEQIAMDEFEEKNTRKKALTAIADVGLRDQNSVLELLASAEQGVQRLGAQLLPKLYRQRPADPQFIVDCVDLSNENDDVGFKRRLIPALMIIDVPSAVIAFEGLELSDIGSRRRLAAVLEDHEAEIAVDGVKTHAVALLRRCAGGTAETGWLGRLESFIRRLEGS